MPQLWAVGNSPLWQPLQGDVEAHSTHLDTSGDYIAEPFITMSQLIQYDKQPLKCLHPRQASLARPTAPVRCRSKGREAQWPHLLSWRMVDPPAQARTEGPKYHCRDQRRAYLEKLRRPFVSVLKATRDMRTPLPEAHPVCDSHRTMSYSARTLYISHHRLASLGPPQDSGHLSPT